MYSNAHIVSNQTSHHEVCSVEWQVFPLQWHIVYTKYIDWKLTPTRLRYYNRAVFVRPHLQGLECPTEQPRHRPPRTCHYVIPSFLH